LAAVVTVADEAEDAEQGDSKCVDVGDGGLSDFNPDFNNAGIGRQLV
jgi:hypothetical protein